MAERMLGPEYAEIERCIPADHARNSSADAMLRIAASRLDQGKPAVLDLGCGDGRAVDQIAAALPSASYDGVDIETSPEVNSRTRDDARFHTFDGIQLPFGDGTFDIVFTQQVMEHVRHPDALIAEVQRVLKPGGFFVGSASGLEPYHSWSIFNLTHYGLFRVIEDNGLTLEQMRPGIDGMAMLFRQLSMRKIGGFSLAYWSLALLARFRGMDARQRNYLKLRFAGHLCFLARKP